MASRFVFETFNPTADDLKRKELVADALIRRFRRASFSSFAIGKAQISDREFSDEQARIFAALGGTDFNSSD